MAPRDAAEVVGLFFAAMQERDWARAQGLIDADAWLEWVATGECFRGADFVAMNRAYPEGWSITVHEVLSAGSRAAARVSVDQDDQTFWCAGFYTVNDGMIVAGQEHWLTAGGEEPPAWRARFRSAGIAGSGSAGSAESVAVGAGFDDVGVERESVDDRRDEPRVGDH